jgi:agmatine deiminase
MKTTETPAALGYRMPPEWHRHTATWLTWPKDPLTWPDRVPQAEAAYLAILTALAPHERVNLLVDDAATEARVRCRFDFPHAENVHFIHLPTVDSWIRDYGPNFLINDAGEIAFNDWEFNAWGNKYGELKQDNAIPARLEPLLRVPRFVPGIVMEGGAIDVNGAGAVLTTEQCLLNPNRNPQLERAEIEQYLKAYLGVEQVLWLGEGIVGDDTDGHVDDIARFIAPDTIVCALEDDPADANYELLRDNYERLRHMTDLAGRSFEIVTLPMPGIVGGRDDRLPASYANFYIANSVVLAPVFGHAHDQRAVETLQRLFKDRTVVPIKAEALVWGMGTIHCLTQQQPATRG